MSDTLNWGILGTGQIARTFVTGLSHSATGRAVAVGSRSTEKAEAFGSEAGIARRHGSYAALLQDPAVQAVYVATPHPEHVEWAVKAADAGKHVLCEKPIGVSHAEAVRIVDAARRNDVFLMEAFMYRCHPQTAKVVELIKHKAIGDVRMIQAAFGFKFPFDPAHRLWSKALAGGGILDVGCYPVSFSRLVAGAAAGEPFLNPVRVVGSAKLHAQTGVDEHAAAVLTFANDVLAQVSTSVAAEQENVARIYGTDGWILVPEPWTPSTKGQPSKVVVHRGSETEEFVFDRGDWLYALEADVVAENVSRRQASAMSWDDTLGNAQTLDAWRAAVGLK